MGRAQEPWRGWCSSSASTRFVYKGHGAGLRRRYHAAMRLLKLHADTACPAVARLEVDVTRPRSGLLALRYVVTGAMRGVSLPPLAEPNRADGLWRRTCFEAFVRTGPGEAYYEFNFSPSTEWAAYRFDGYRQGMRPAEGLDAPRIEPITTDQGFELRVSLDLNQVPGLAKAGAWRLGLSAVIEDAAGGISYWALAHPPGKADFHHADGFALDLPAPGSP